MFLFCMCGPRVSEISYVEKVLRINLWVVIPTAIVVFKFARLFFVRNIFSAVFRVCSMIL